jgi:prevent-host-death family protein
MSGQLSQRELRNQSGEIMRRLDAGEDFVVTRNGVPVGHLLPNAGRRFVRTETAIAALGNAPAIELVRFRTDVDTALDQDPAPRA